MQNNILSLEGFARPQLKNKPTESICEWIDCNFSSCSFEKFQEHLINHLKILYNETSNNNDMKCGICHSQLHSDLSAFRHMYYHAYHLYLKGRGNYIIHRFKLDGCTHGNESSNDIPYFEHSFICQWESCTYTNDNISDFYNHIDDHAVAEVNIKNYKCKWLKCAYTTKTSGQLKAHLKLHCERRCISCPTCGLCFATNRKFTDHLKRQLVSAWNKEMQDKEMNQVLTTLAMTNNPVIPLPKPIVAPPIDALRCNICFHLFATKSLLKNHEIRHILTRNCPHCNQTCTTPYALKRHILFRHTEEKPFRCTECEMAFKCNDGLKRHFAALHIDQDSVNSTSCDETGCTFVAKDKRALKIHKSRIHCKLQTIVTKVYVCHECDQEYVKGNCLTEHLSKYHGLNKTVNRRRHQFTISADGKYRLNMFEFKLKTTLKEEQQRNPFVPMFGMDETNNIAFNRNMEDDSNPYALNQEKEYNLASIWNELDDYNEDMVYP